MSDWFPFRGGVAFPQFLAFLFLILFYNSRFSNNNSKEENSDQELHAAMDQEDGAATTSVDSLGDQITGIDIVKSPLLLVSSTGNTSVFCDPDTLQLAIVPMNGAEFSISVPKTATVAELKQEISKQKGHEKREQRLVFKDDFLNDNDTLLEVGLGAATETLELGRLQLVIDKPLHLTNFAGCLVEGRTSGAVGDIKSILSPYDITPNWLTSPGGVFTKDGKPINDKHIPVLAISFDSPVDIVEAYFVAGNPNCAKRIRFNTPDNQVAFIGSESSPPNPRSEQTMQLWGDPATWVSPTGIPLSQPLCSVLDLEVTVLENHGDTYFGINRLIFFGYPSQ
jgi:hypothetical protein